VSRHTDAHARIDRAEEHLAQLKVRLDAHLKSYEDVSVVRVVGVRGEFPKIDWKSLPRPDRILIGEVVQNLRAALDYLIYQLADWYSGPDPDRRTQFPIESDPEVFRGRRRNSYLKGVCDEHVAAIERLQPYGGPNWLSRLQEISNEDKHNVIVAAPQLKASAQISVGLSDEEAIARGGFRKPGDVGMYFKMPVYVALQDGTPVVEVLEELKTETRALLQVFEPEFEREPPPMHLRPPKRKPGRRRPKKKR
jgi:hypothetical protein